MTFVSIALHSPRSQATWACFCSEVIPAVSGPAQSRGVFPLSCDTGHANVQSRSEGALFPHLVNRDTAWCHKTPGFNLLTAMFGLRHLSNLFIHRSLQWPVNELVGQVSGNDHDSWTQVTDFSTKWTVNKLVGQVSEDKCLACSLSEILYIWW